ncbi:signal peptidase I [Peptostreptococcaceae bacterium AGR-M142]
MDNSNLKKEILEWVKTIAVSVVIAFFITLFVRPTLVQGKSMYPTLNPNDYLIVNKIAYKSDMPKKGDIVIFKSDLKREDGKTKDLIKRVIGLPGDHIVVENGDVYVNDLKLDENYINGDYTQGDVDVVIPENHLFAMGDNRPNSLDSRSSSVGLVDKEELVGKAFLRLFPFNKIGFLK